jgi:hypothetical protein
MRAGGTEEDEAFAVAVDGAGNACVAGYFTRLASFGSFTLSAGKAPYIQMFVARLDRDGTFLWARTAGADSRAQGVAIDAAGNCTVVGQFQGSATLGSATLRSAGKYDLFAARLDTRGSFTWAASAGGAYSDYARGVALDGGGGAHFIGTFIDRAAFGATTLGASAALRTQVFVARLDGTGRFTRAVTAPGVSGAAAVTAGSKGETTITGLFNGGARFGSHALTSAGDDDIYVARLDAGGAFSWATRAGGVERDYGTAVALDGAGNTYLAASFRARADFGSTTLTSGGQWEVAVARLDSRGAFAWATGSSSLNSGSIKSYALSGGLAVDGAGNSYLCGRYSTQTTLGGTTLSGSALLVARFSALGKVVWVDKAGNYKDSANSAALDGAGQLLVVGRFYGSGTFGAGTLRAQGSATGDVFVWKRGI